MAVCNAHQDATAVLLGKLHEVNFCRCNRCWAIERLPQLRKKQNLHVCYCGTEKIAVLSYLIISSADKSLLKHYQVLCKSSISVHLTAHFSARPCCRPAPWRCPSAWCG